MSGWGQEIPKDKQLQKINENQQKNTEILQKEQTFPQEQYFFSLTKQGLFYGNINQSFEQLVPIFLSPSVKDYKIDISDRFVVAASQNELIVIKLDEKFTQFKCNESFIRIEYIDLQEDFIQILDRQDQDKFHFMIFKLENFQFKKVYDLCEDKFQQSLLPLCKFRDEFAYVASFCKGNVMILNKEDFKQVKEINAGVIDGFTVNKSKFQTVFACLQHERLVNYQITKGYISVFNNDKQEPILKQQLMNSQDMNPMWSPCGQYLLLFTWSMFDQSHQNYYGNNSLYHYSVLENQLKQIDLNTDRIHAVQWANNGQEFTVISGQLPANIETYNKIGNKIFTFPKTYCNLLQYNNFDTYIAFAGFGNLSGDIEIWDVKNKVKIGSCVANSSHILLWAPDGINFLTACINPKLRVDNNIQVWSARGLKKQFIDFKSTELYKVSWDLKNSIIYSSFTLQQINEEVKPVEQKAFKAIGGKKFHIKGTFAEMMKNRHIPEVAQNQIQQVNQIQQKEVQKQLKPGQSEPPQKKKRIRHKKDKEKQENGEI